MTSNFKDKLKNLSKDNDIIEQFGQILELPDKQFDTIYPKMREALAQQFETNIVKKKMLEEIEMMPNFSVKEEIDSMNAFLSEIEKEKLSKNKKELLLYMVSSIKDIFQLAIRNPRDEIKIPIVKINPDAILPTYAHELDAGADVYAVEETIFSPRETKIVKTGIKIAVPAGYEVQVRPRSGMSLKTKIRVANAPGTIDSGYTGEVGVIMENIGFEPYTIHQGDKIAQLVLMPVPMIKWNEVDELPETERGTNGYGSTDKS